MELAAELVARGNMLEPAIAELAGCSTRQLHNWTQGEYFQARLQHHLEVQRKAIEATGIAIRQNRIRAQNERWMAMQRVISERAAAVEYAQVPGWPTGLLVHNVRSIGGGKSAERVDLFEVDTGLLRELRELEKHTAIELGQWEEKSQHSGVIGIQNIVELEVATTSEETP